jgi:hypothetical protein
MLQPPTLEGHTTFVSTIPHCDWLHGAVGERLRRAWCKEGSTDDDKTADCLIGRCRDGRWVGVDVMFEMFWYELHSIFEIQICMFVNSKCTC